MVFVKKLHDIKMCFILLPVPVNATERKCCPARAQREFT